MANEIQDTIETTIEVITDTVDTIVSILMG